MTNIPNPLTSVLFPYQYRYATDTSRFKAWVASRQIGKSFCIGFETSLEAADGTDSILISTGERASKELILKVRQAADVVCDALALVGVPLSYKAKSTEIEFSNGARVFSLPGKPESMRGYTGNVFIDEAAIIERFEEVWAAAFPIITNEIQGKKFKLRVSSTPKGKNSKFFDIIERSGPEWSIHRTSIYDAVEQGLPVDVSELKAQMDDADRFEQEYNLAWLEEASQMYPYDLIESCFDRLTTLDPGVFEVTNDRRFGGFDVGRHHDLSVFWTLREREQNVFFTEEVLALNKVDFESQQRLVGERIPRCMKTAVDAQGIGDETAERLQAKWGEGLVEACKITNEFKNRVFPGLKSMMQRGAIRIPENAQIKSELGSIEKVVTQHGNITYRAARTPDGHSDRATALALAAYATTLSSGVWTAESIKRARLPRVRNDLDVQPWDVLEA